MIMRRVEALVLISTISTSILAAESARPRILFGVSPEFAKFYQDPQTFTCISNPLVSLSASQINDDFCDCPDGSDEPGTAACTYLSPLSPPQPFTSNGTPGEVLALPGFYCRNKGHISAYIPHTFVNDGVCDYEICCDGSDEWASPGGVKCENKCKEIGKEWKRLDDMRQKAAVASAKKRVELVNEAQALRAGIEIKIGRMEMEIKGLETKAEELKKKYEDVERRERGRVVKGTEGKASKVTVLAGLAKQRVEELRESLIKVVGRRDALRQRVEELEGILSTFKEEYNPNFNDEGVKRAVKSWEDYAANKVDDGDVAAEERDIESISKPDSDTEGINWAEWEEGGDESDVDALYAIEAYLPESVRAWVHQKILDFRLLLIENGIMADAPQGSESAAVASARTAFQTVKDDVSSKQASLGDLQNDLNRDYGPSDIFRALKGKCVSKDSGEYEYELCWLEQTKQKSKKGGGHTGMGKFVRFDRMYVDEEVGADGKGLGVGERLVLQYENGQHCWNGPNRQTTVVLGCAEKDEVWKVVEQEKCMYRMDVGTPAACEEVGGDAKEGGKKDEL